MSEAQASERSSLSSSQKKRIKTWLKVRLSLPFTHNWIPPDVLPPSQRCRAHPSHSQISLESYLLLPLQRVPRYKMLLESLSTCTPSPYSSPSLLDPTSSFSKSSPSLSLTSSIRLEPHPALVQAVQEMDEVATVLNEVCPSLSILCNPGSSRTHLSHPHRANGRTKVARSFSDGRIGSSRSSRAHWFNHTGRWSGAGTWCVHLPSSRRLVLLSVSRYPGKTER